MKKTREPAVAGTFYPAEKDKLKHMIEQFILDAPKTNKVPKAIIVPHAAYIYSGELAAAIYARLIPDNNKISQVILMGPSHKVGFRGMALSTAEHFSTPLGLIDIDIESNTQLSQFPFIQFMDQAHELEHSIEVHLPFLQVVLKQFTLLPIVCGYSSTNQVCSTIEQFWGQPETLIVISSDLSHFHKYETAQKKDEATSNFIEKLEFEHLNSDSACGYIPISGLLALARKNDLDIKMINLKNSVDTSEISDKNRVVGYGTYVIE